MSQWNNGPYAQDPNQAYYAGQPGYPPQPGAYPPAGGYPTAPPSGYPGAAPAGYPPGPGFQPPPYAPNDPYSAGVANYSGEDPEVKGFDFSDASIRRGFIRKVYSILCVQLSITLGFIAWFLYHTPTRKYVQSHPALFIIALIVIIVALITLACCGEVRRKAPMNFIFLFIFTFAEAFILAVSSSTYESEEVIMAVGITAAVCLGLTLFAFQTKWDFTMMGGILFVAVIILFVFGIVAIFVHNRIVKLVYASLGALIFSIYLVYDTQLMLGGKHKYSISPEEYIFAALNLYIDIVNIFMYILTIIGTSRD
ncbi:protein lifeguard 1 isoform X2 [Anoplophora glabripennis]|uniref:protein lifeguard 1 isoform X2 n=1 Tax=Anoplophora glabripennis TaxID=217634 RepID=UPI00087479AD|nr:protein lifeguard 1 isoform X2 [Anoplophora glabripennis]